MLRRTATATAWVYTNDPNNKLVLLAVTASIRPIIELLPEPSLYVQVNKGVPAEGRLTVVNHDPMPLRITELGVNNKAFSTELRTLEDGQRYELLVRLPAQQAEGRFATLVTLNTNNERLLKIPIAVVVTVSAGMPQSH